ncbi:MAG: response regulator transcription factor [Acidimicrobiales bacterium]
MVEDEESYREALQSALRLEGFRVELAVDGGDGIRRFGEHIPDIVLLDLLLPDMHGTDVLRRMHAIAPVPILIISAVDSEIDTVLGLELGAADYVTKPFRSRELVARIHTILRRASALDPTTATSSEPGRHAAAVRPDSVSRGTAGQSVERPDLDLDFGRFKVSFVRHEVTVDGTLVHLSRREYELLVALLTPRGAVRTRDELIDLLWPTSELVDSRTLDTHIYRLRTKLEIDPSSPKIIVTVRGVGFRLDLDQARPPFGDHRPAS